VTQNKTSLIVLIVIALAIGFVGGLYYAQSQDFDSELSFLPFKNKTVSQPDGVDFSLFWDVYNLIEERYVDKNDTSTEELLYGAIEGLLGALGDPYTVFLEPVETKKFNESINGEFGGVGIEIGLRNGVLTIIAPLEGTPGERAGLLAGDVITAIDEKSTLDIKLHEAVEQIRGKRNTAVILTISRETKDESFDVSVIRDTIKVPAVRMEILDSAKYGLAQEKRIAHVKLHTFNRNVDDQFKDIARELLNEDVTAIILDLRNNPGGLLDSSVNIASYFLNPEETVVIERFGDGKENLFKTSHNAQLKNIPIVILINEGSASASEILAGALRDVADVVVVGETSFGKGSVQQVAEMQYGTSVKITIAKWLTPNGISINEEGIIPDFEIERTIEHIENNEDPQLEKAIEILNTM